MYIADLLSRNVSKNNKVEDDESMKDIIHTVKIGEIKFSEEKMTEYKQKLLEDDTLKKVVEYYKNGWPNRIKRIESETELVHYSKLKNEITMEEELVYWNNRLLIPKSLRTEMLDLLHETHLT